MSRNSFASFLLLVPGLLLIVTACSPPTYEGSGCVQPGMKAGEDLDPAYFSIYTSTVNGENLRRLYSDPCRELNHARISPDGQWITFTRYNQRNPTTGLATENTGYGNTEIMVGRMDGSELKSVVGPRSGEISGNGYWTPDGKGILFVSMKHGQLPAIKRLDLSSGAITTINTKPDGINTDPHRVGGKLVFASRERPSDPNSIWVVDSSATAKQISFPQPTRETQRLAKSHPGLGDFDPKLSPDAKSVVFMRRAAKDSWHVVKVDLATGEASNLSGHDATDAVPEWSPDGRDIIFWHADLKNLKNSGLYVMQRDGSNRRRIPLPGGYFYTMPAFAPINASNPDGRMIVFSAKKEPLL